MNNLQDGIESIIEWLRRSEVSPKTSILCLQALRIFSRDKSNMASLTSDCVLRTLISCSGIDHYAQQDAGASAVVVHNGDQTGK